MCGLGEEILPPVLHVWGQMRPSTKLKEEMVEFFNVQMTVHHPRGAKTEETGKGPHARDWAPGSGVMGGLRGHWSVNEPIFSSS